MPAILKQRHLLITKIFELTDNSLKIAIKSPFNYIEEEFPFEEITTKSTRKVKTSPLAVIPAVFFIIGTIITTISFFVSEKDPLSIGDIVFYVILAIIFSFYAFLRREQTVNLLLTDRTTLAFYQKSPSATQVTEFLTRIKAEQKLYLLNRYAKHDPFLSPDQLSNNLIWLFDREIITLAELDKLRSRLLFKSTESAFHFNFNHN